MTRLQLTKAQRERLGITEGGAAQKFANETTEMDGRVFASKLEARRYRDLRLLEQSGAISGLVCQPRYVLIPADAHGRAICYVGDFAYTEGGRAVVEDTKGAETDVWRIKRRLFLARYPDVELRVLREGEV